MQSALGNTPAQVAETVANIQLRDSPGSPIFAMGSLVVFGIMLADIVARLPRAPVISYRRRLELAEDRVEVATVCVIDTVRELTLAIDRSTR